MQNMNKEIKEIEKDKKLDKMEKALLILALTNLISNRKKINKIKILHIKKLEEIRREVAYIKLYKKDLRGLKRLLAEIQKELTAKEVELVSSSLSDSYRDSHSKVLEILGTEDIELEDEVVESEVYKEFYGDTFDNRIDTNNKLFISEIALIGEDLETADFEQIDRELEDAILNKLERLEVLFDNEMMRVFNLALTGAYVVANIVLIRYSAELDNRTCGECEGLEGTVYNIFDDDIPDLPLHPRCRCILIPE